MKRYLQTVSCLGAALTVLLAVACSSGDGPGTEAPATEPVAVAFSATVPAFATRSIVNDTEDLRTAGFGVFAYYTGNVDWNTAKSTSAPNFMYNQQVNYGSGSWTYTPVKYWPNDNQPADDSGATGSQTHSYVSFFAFAPYNGDGLALSGNTATGAPTITYTWGATNDLLYAEPVKNCYKTMPAGYGTVTGQVPFTFRHALALVEFRVRRKTSTGSTITLRSLGITSNGDTGITSNGDTGGTFDLETGVWTDTTAGSAAPLSYTSPDISVTASTDETAQPVGRSVMMPGLVTFNYTIDYTVGSNNYLSAASMSPMTLAMGYKYTIVFVIDGDQVESYVLREREAEQW